MTERDETRSTVSSQPLDNTGYVISLGTVLGPEGRDGRRGGEAETGPVANAMSPGRPRSADAAGVDLYWLPLGAGGHSVRWNGRLFEAIVSRREHRPAQDLFHAALEVHHGDDLS